MWPLRCTCSHLSKREIDLPALVVLRRAQRRNLNVKRAKTATIWLPNQSRLCPDVFMVLLQLRLRLKHHRHIAHYTQNRVTSICKCNVTALHLTAGLHLGIPNLPTNGSLTRQSRVVVNQGPLEPNVSQASSHNRQPEATCRSRSAFPDTIWVTLTFGFAATASRMIDLDSEVITPTDHSAWECSLPGGINRACRGSTPSAKTTQNQQSNNPLEVTSLLCFSEHFRVQIKHHTAHRRVLQTVVDRAIPSVRESSFPPTFLLHDHLHWIAWSL